MWKKCKCEELTPVKKDGYQYCKQCGKAHAAPAPNLGPLLQHELEDIRGGYSEIRRQTLTGPVTQTILQQRCRNCGRRFTYNTTMGEYDTMSKPDKVPCIQAGQRPVT